MLSPLFVQLNPRVGDLEGNRKRLQSLLLQAGDYPLALVPELALTGYPPRDLLEQEGLAAALGGQIDTLAAALRDCGPVILGALAPTTRSPGWLNAAYLLRDGEATMVAQKQLLPDYDVFDEPRYFAVGEPSAPLTVAGCRVGVTICEDLWGGQEVGEGARYDHLPAEGLAHECDLLVNLSASPYQRGKPAERLAQAERFARRAGCAVAMVNAVGGNDELVFDGHSFWTDGQVSKGLDGFRETAAYAQRNIVFGSDLEVDRAALVLGLRDYLHKCGAKQVVLGVSGGIDSALVAALAVDAIGGDNVLGLAMPSRYSSQRSLDDAHQLAHNLGFECREVSLEGAHAQMRALLSPVFSVAGLTDENLQARLRGLMVMAAANSEGRFALATGNKSELAVGYCTMYGDMCGAVAPIGDLFKTDVFALAALDARIPRSIVDAPPSAELRDDQKDEDSLPPYAVLDAILEGLVVQKKHPSILLAQGHDSEHLHTAIRLLDQSEFKRRQAAPVIRVSAKAFGIGRRQPLAWKRGF